MKYSFAVFLISGEADLMPTKKLIPKATMATIDINLVMLFFIDLKRSFRIGEFIRLTIQSFQPIQEFR